MLDFFASGGIPMMIVNLLGVILVIVAVERYISLYARKDHQPENLGKRMVLIKFIGLSSAIVGINGTLIGIHRSCSNADEIIARLGEFSVYEVIRIAVSTSIWGLTISLLALIIYSILKAKTAALRLRLEQPSS
jgi:biopolymer transport protein ExbB/TolQ